LTYNAARAAPQECIDGSEDLDFKLTEDQSLLHDMVDRAALEQHDFRIRRSAIQSAAGWHRPFWRQLAELGVLGAPIPEALGGSAGGSISVMLIMRVFGRRLVISPYIPTVVCAAGLLARAGTEAQRNEHLPKILAGERIFAFACSEAGDHGDAARMQMTAVRSASGYRLSGGKTLVVGAAWSDQLVVIAKLAETQELAAFIVPQGASNMTARHRRLIDGSRASEITFEGLFVPEAGRIGVRRNISQEIERSIDEAVVALCAEASGSIDALLTSTVAYAKTRHQFGQPLAKFQALQHRMVDMLIAREQSISIIHRAALSLDGEPGTRRRTVSAAKAQVGRLGRFAAQAAVQIHGGIGTTDELDVSHHFRRIELFNLQFGTVDDHVRRYASLLESPTPEG
jgi:alkylation response protein AidB-like acyl-CoA dehydrogenase